MNGKTFLKTYINEDPNIVMKTQFVLVSSTIRKSGKYEKQIINANANLFPDQTLIMDYDDWKHNKNYHAEYLEKLSENDGLFATLIKYAIEENMTIVFLCGEREKKYYYFPLIQKYVGERFGYHIYDYKKYKEGKEPIRKFNQMEVLATCEKVLKKVKKKQKERKMTTEHGRQELVKDMSKKQLIKKLKKRNLYYEGMSKQEMRDMMEIFM
jgi:hypothetical protein